jgi:hypothetical protein
MPLPRNPRRRPAFAPWTHLPVGTVQKRRVKNRPMPFAGISLLLFLKLRAQARTRCRHLRRNKIHCAYSSDSGSRVLPVAVFDTIPATALRSIEGKIYTLNCRAQVIVELGLDFNHTEARGQAE